MKIILKKLLLTIACVIVVVFASYKVTLFYTFKRVPGTVVFSDSVGIYFSKANNINYDHKLATTYKVVRNPALSHDGKKLVFSAQIFDAQDEKYYNRLVVINERGGGYFNEYDIIFSLDVDDQIGHFSWSPDDQKIAFLGGKDIYYFGRGGLKLYLLDLLIGKTQQILDNFEFACAPVSWSHDGKFLLFSTQDKSIMKYDVKKEDITKITSGYYVPQCSPKNDLVLYSDMDNIYLSDLKGRSPKILIKRYGGFSSFTDIAWSPDGNCFIYTRNSSNFLYRLTGPTVDLVMASFDKPLLLKRAFSVAHGIRGLSWSN